MEPVTAGGPESEGSGGAVRSTVQACSAGSLSAPSASTALTANECDPSVSAVSSTGLVHTAKSAWSRLQTNETLVSSPENSR